MDRARSPYTPNAGAPPKYLAGRANELEDFRVLLKRLSQGYTEQSLVITGLRGVGKTVLLGEYQKTAAEENWVAVDGEVEGNAVWSSDREPCSACAAPSLPESSLGRARTTSSGRGEVILATSAA